MLILNSDRPPSSLSNVTGEFDAAAKHLNLSEDQVALIKEPRFSARLKFPVQLDDGRVKIFRAFHTIHSTMRGPSIGGVQIRPKIDTETVDALAFWSSHRCALLGIPFGGSCGAIECDPQMFSLGEMERISRRYVADLKHLVSPNNDILTADIGSNQQTMCWFMDTYSAHERNYSPAVVLGKPLGLGGTAFPFHPVAMGIDLCVRKACEHIGLSIKGSRVAIQGFGKVGMNVAKLLHTAGAKIIAVSDISGAYFDPKGINIDRVIWHQQSYGILDGLAGEMDIEKMDDPSKLFELDADILIPAAIELQITKENAGRIKAKIIAEAANDPVSPAADQKLYKDGVIIIPDILCNSGGATGYYLEWVMNRTGYYWGPELLQKEVENVVGKAFDSVLNISQKEKIPFRLAAAILAVKRLSSAAGLRGIYA